MSGMGIGTDRVRRIVGWMIGLLAVATGSLGAETMQRGTAGAEILDAAGARGRFEVPVEPAAWAARQTEVRAELGRLLGRIPPRPKVPPVVVKSVQERDGHVEERFEFDNGAGARVPGILLRPVGKAGRAPAILFCHWHGGEYDIGKEELLQKRHTPEVPGIELVRRGYVVLAIDAPCFGERNGKGPDGERGSAGEMSASKLELWLGRSLWGMLLRDDLMALDYLCSRPEVDTDRIGVTGISMGATRSWWLMALDERIKAGVAVACLTRYEELIRANGLRYHGIYYYVPGLLAQFDTEAVVACAAPRALLCLNGDQDAGSPVAGIREIEKRARPAWERAGRSDSFRSIVYPGVGHEYTPAMWSEMMGWFDRHLVR